MKKYIQYIFQMLKYLNKRDLSFKLKKCEFYCKKVDFLEFVVEQYKIRINLNKLKTIKE